MGRLVTLVLVVGLVVAACAGDGDGGSTTSSPADPSTTQDASTTTESADMTTTTSAAATTTTEPSSASGDDCLVGSWELDSKAFVENFDSIMTEAGMPDAEVTALDGRFTVEMSADGTYIAIRDQWGFNMATPEGTVIIEINGDETGSWSTDGSTLSINPEESDLAVESFVEVDGELVALPFGQVPIEAPPGLATNSEFECSADVLRVANEGVESVLNRN
ncbi:MAG TPA: hypothetical protein VF115_00105 [Acidimicrobiia bacterium]